MPNKPISPKPTQTSRFFVCAAYFRRSIGFFDTQISALRKIVSLRRLEPLDARITNGYDTWAAVWLLSIDFSPVGGLFWLSWSCGNWPKSLTSR